LSFDYSDYLFSTHVISLFQMINAITNKVEIEKLKTLCSRNPSVLSKPKFVVHKSYLSAPQQFHCFAIVYLYPKLIITYDTGFDKNEAKAKSAKKLRKNLQNILCPKIDCRITYNSRAPNTNNSEVQIIGDTGNDTLNALTGQRTNRADDLIQFE